MKRRLLSWSFAVALSLATTSVFAQEQASAPSFKEGDIWQFKLATKEGSGSSTAQNDDLYELTFTQGKVKLFNLNGNQKDEMQVGGGLY